MNCPSAPEACDRSCAHRRTWPEHFASSAVRAQASPRLSRLSLLRAFFSTGGRRVMRENLSREGAKYFFPESVCAGRAQNALVLEKCRPARGVLRLPDHFPACAPVRGWPAIPLRLPSRRAGTPIASRAAPSLASSEVHRRFGKRNRSRRCFSVPVRAVRFPTSAVVYQASDQSDSRPVSLWKNGSPASAVAGENDRFFL